VIDSTLNQTTSLEEFLAAPVEEVRQVAPETVILGAGGTRRSAVLAGIEPQSDEYVAWTREQMMNCLSLIFRHGVKHIFSPLLVHSHQHEVTPGYSDHVVNWIREGLAGESPMDDYVRLGWRVRLIGAESWQGLEGTADKLISCTEHNPGPTVWFTVISNIEAYWERLFCLVLQNGATTRAEIVRLVYGEDIPPATLYLGTGKPQIVESIVPPLLIGKLECYWRQHLGYDIDEKTLRTILYDYVHVRRLAPTDKTGRAEQVIEHLEAWQDPSIVGMGMRLGPFWYPAPLPAVQQTEMEMI
jgi:hypothetical protein